MTRTLKIGTRGSALALAQANWLKRTIEQTFADTVCELTIIKTAGDRFVDRPLRSVGGKGLFVKEIEEALLSGAVDCAIHSMKDVPAELPPGLEIAAVPAREDRRDVLISRTPGGLAALADDAVIGTCSLRRGALLRSLRPGVRLLELRGNVDSRLRKLEEGQLDAIVLAAAGLRRLGLAPANCTPFDPETFLPAIGQGALAIETRGDAVGELLRRLDDADTRDAVEAERAFLAATGGSCHTPLAAMTHLSGDRLTIDALIVEPDGTRVLREREEGDRRDAARLGHAVGARLLAGGGAEIIARLEAAGATA